MKSILILGLFCLSCSPDTAVRAVYVCPPPVSRHEALVWGAYHWELSVHQYDGQSFLYCGADEGLWLDLDPEEAVVIQFIPLEGLLAEDSPCTPVTTRQTASLPLSLPAGALWPWDAKGPLEIEADWFGGIRANFFLELARREYPGGRRVETFNWPRFRVLLEAGQADGSFPLELWSVDWGSVARKTLDMGFDRRRIKAQSFSWTVDLPAEAGTWLSDSPFMRAVDNDEAGSLTVYGRPQAHWWRADACLSASAEGSVTAPRTVE